jgi:hypothetical protein
MIHKVPRFDLAVVDHPTDCDPAIVDSPQGVASRDLGG